MSRTDDILNVAGHRLSTGALEAAIATHPDVAEVAVIGPADQLKGQVPVALVVPKDGRTTPDDEVGARHGWCAGGWAGARGAGWWMPPPLVSPLTPVTPLPATPTHDRDTCLTAAL